MAPDNYDLEDLGVECTLKKCRNSVILHLSNGVAVEGIIDGGKKLKTLLNSGGDEFFSLSNSRCLHGAFCSTGEKLIINRNHVVFAEGADNEDQ